MEIIKGLVQTLIIIIVLAVFLEMLLPGGKMTPYVKMVMGLMVIVGVLQAISGLLQQNWLQEVPGITYRASSAGSSLEDIMVAGEQLRQKNQDLALEQYRRGISNQVLALAQTTPGLNIVDAEVKLGETNAEQGYGRITEVTLIVVPTQSRINDRQAGNVSQPVEPVRIKVGEFGETRETVPDSDVPREIQIKAREAARSVAGFYGLPPEKVTIEFQAADAALTEE